MDINQTLKQLYTKYKINITYNKNNIRVKIKKIFDSIPHGSLIGIRGGGEHTKKLLEFLEPEHSVIAIFDQSNDGELEFGIKSLPPEKMIDIPMDYIIISSFKYRSEMKLQIQHMNLSVKIIDIYEQLEQMGEPIFHSFYFYETYPIGKIIDLQKLYDKTDKLTDKENLLESIIYAYLEIKDFISAKKFINQYISYNFKNSIRYKLFLQDINLMFENIKQEIKQRNKEDIIIFWIDMLGYKEIEEVPYLFNKSKSSIFFENAFTVTPTTFPTFQTMFSKKNRLDYLDYFSEKNGCVIKKLEENGYHFSLIGINTENFIHLKKEGFDFNLLERYAVCCEKYWNMLDFILKHENPLCLVVHELAETHFPYLSPWLKNPIYDMTAYIDDFRGETISAQRKLSRLYLSEQLKFFDNLLGDNIKKIFMSDHGFQSDIYVKRYMDEANHIMFYIVDKTLSPQKYQALFSLENFDKVLDYLITPTKHNEQKIFANEHLIFHQDVDFYSKRLVETLVSKEIPEYGLAYQAIRGIYDKYVVTSDGKEYYFILPDEINNQIEAKQFQERISYLRNKVTNKFYSVNNIPKFLYSRALYKALKN